MNPRHHPSPDILAQYASGMLEPGFGLVVGAHVEVCPACRSRVSAFEAASGETFDELPTPSMAPDALARTFEKVAATEPEAATSIDDRGLMGRLPLKPKRWVAPGVWAAAVDTPHAPQNRVYVLSVPKGMTAARHQHTGAEYCTVLQGAYRDELGLFKAGDFIAVEGDVSHQPIVDGDEACVCLFATEGRLKPSGLIGRIAFALADV